jgi:hypothetical protein
MPELALVVHRGHPPLSCVVLGVHLFDDVVDLVALDFQNQIEISIVLHSTWEAEAAKTLEKSVMAKWYARNDHVSRHLLFPQVLRFVQQFAHGRVKFNGVDPRELGLEKYITQAVECVSAPVPGPRTPEVLTSAANPSRKRQKIDNPQTYY